MKTTLILTLTALTTAGCATTKTFNVDGGQVKAEHWEEQESFNFPAKAKALPWNYDLAYTINARPSSGTNPGGVSSGDMQSAVFGGTGLLGAAGLADGILSNGFSLGMGALGVLTSQPAAGVLARQQWSVHVNPNIVYTRIRSGVDLMSPDGQESVVRAEHRFMSLLHEEDPSCNPDSARREFKGNAEYEGVLLTSGTPCGDSRGIPPTYLAQNLTALDGKNFPGNILYETAYAFGSAPLRAASPAAFDDLLAKTKKKYLATLAKAGWLMLYTRPDKPGRVVVRPDGKEERKPIPPKP